MSELCFHFHFPYWCATLYGIQNILHVISKLFLFWIFTNPQIIWNENFHMRVFVCLFMSIPTLISCKNRITSVTETKCSLTYRMWLKDGSILNVFLKSSLRHTASVDGQTQLPISLTSVLPETVSVLRIDTAELHRVYDNMLQRAQKCTDVQGDHFQHLL